MDSKKNTWFSKFFLSTLIFLIIIIICFNFFCSSNPLEITAGLILLLVLLTLVILSETFDNLSIAKLFSISKTLKEEESKNKELKKEIFDLRSQFITITSNLNQKQNNSTHFYSGSQGYMSVKNAEDIDKLQKDKQEEVEETTTTTTTTSTTTHTENKEPFRSQLTNSLIYEEVALSKFLESEGLREFPIIRNAKFTNHFQQIDPVSEFSPIFDGYIKTIESEIFIETKLKYRGTGTFRDRLYLMLSKINYYRTIKRVNSYLILVLIVNKIEVKNESIYKRILNDFEPAISNGLLRIREIEISNDDINNYNIS